MATMRKDEITHHLQLACQLSCHIQVLLQMQGRRTPFLGKAGLKLQA
jgi:hypothetical protein